MIYNYDLRRVIFAWVLTASLICRSAVMNVSRKNHLLSLGLSSQFVPASAVASSYLVMECHFLYKASAEVASNAKSLTQVAIIMI